MSTLTTADYAAFLANLKTRIRQRQLQALREHGHCP